MLVQERDVVVATVTVLRIKAICYDYVNRIIIHLLGWDLF